MLKLKIPRFSLTGMIRVLYISVLTLLLMLPQFLYSMSIVQVIILAMPLIMGLVLRYKKNQKRIFTILLFLAGMFFFRYCVNTFLQLKPAMNLSIITLYTLIPALCFFALAESDVEPWERKTVVLITVIGAAVVLVNTFLVFQVMPTVARMLARGDNSEEEIQLLRQMNIGGFGFSYAIGILIPYVALWIKRSTGTKRGVFCALYAVLFLFGLKTQYTTLILLAVAFSMYVFQRGKKITIGKLLVFAAAGLGVFFLPNIFAYLGEHIQLETLACHFKDLAYSLAGGASSSSRKMLALNALKVFASAPIFGADLTDPQVNYILNHSHSNYLGILGGGGVIGTTVYIGLFLFIIREIKREIPTFRDFRVIYLMYFVLGFLNPNTSPEISISIFLLIPLIELITERNGRKNGNTAEVGN